MKHKHKFKLTGVSAVVYVFRCWCGHDHWVHRESMRRMLTGVR